MAKLILNIYGKERNDEGQRKIEKTYTVDSCELLYGPIEDVVDVLDIKKLDNNIELIKLIATMMKQIKPILKDVFYGLTDEELKYTKTKELITVVFGILSETLSGILTDEDVKNVIWGQK